MNNKPPCKNCDTCIKKVCMCEDSFQFGTDISGLNKGFKCRFFTNKIK